MFFQHTYGKSRTEKKSKSKPDDQKCVGEREKKVFLQFLLLLFRRIVDNVIVTEMGLWLKLRKALYIINEKRHLLRFGLVNLRSRSSIHKTTQGDGANKKQIALLISECGGACAVVRGLLGKPKGV
jgi:hypothetical protein